VIRTSLGLGLLAAIVLLAAGCGSSDTPGTPPPAAAPPTIPTAAPPTSNRPVPVTPDPLTATPPAGATALPADRVDTSGLPAGLPGLVWTRGDREVGAYGRAGGCTDARLSVVEQGADRVVLRVEQFTTGPGPCTRELVYPPLEATLEAPLGERPVVLTGAVP
jgi:hypothetical protein